MKLIFLRHGEAEHNLPTWQVGTDNFGARLTNAGQQAVLKSARELRQFNFIAAYASPMLRTRQTARLVLDQLQSAPKLQTDDRLSDVYIANRLGNWYRWQKLWRLKLKACRQPKREEQLAKHQLVGGRSLGETVTPIAGFLADLSQKRQKGAVLVVAHLHTFWALTASLKEGSLTDILRARNFLAPGDWREIDVSG